MRRLLFIPDPPEGGGTPPGEGTPPPAAKKVSESDVSEKDAARIVELERALADEKAGRKKDQSRINELEDTLHQLKQLPKDTLPKPEPEKKKSAWTFFG